MNVLLALLDQWVHWWAGWGLKGYRDRDKRLD